MSWIIEFFQTKFRQYFLGGYTDEEHKPHAITDENIIKFLDSIKVDEDKLSENEEMYTFAHTYFMKKVFSKKQEQGVWNFLADLRDVKDEVDDDIIEGFVMSLISGAYSDNQGLVSNFALNPLAKKVLPDMVKHAAKGRYDHWDICRN